MGEQQGGDAAWLGFERELGLRAEGDSSFLGHCRAGRGSRVFGGHVAAHAVVAAGARSGSGMQPLSVHAHFLRAGEATRPVVYLVTALRAGRSFEHWRVDATQNRQIIATHVVVLHRPDPVGRLHAATDPHPERPEELSSVAEPPRAGTSTVIRQAFDIRRGRAWSTDGPGETPFQRVWFRCTEPLSRDPFLRAAVLVWATDLEVAWTADLPYRSRIRDRRAASLDHVVHLHRALDPQDWWLYEQRSPVLDAGRALVQGSVFAAGRLVASVSQQALLRLTLDDELAKRPLGG